jgi:hypothetical protein
MPVADIVNAWFKERLANGAIARDTAAYNQAHAALPDLISRLDGEPEAKAKGGKSKTSPAPDAPEPEQPPAEQPSSDQ